MFKRAAAHEAIHAYESTLTHDINDVGHDKHGHSRFKIGVSGAAETGHCGLDAYEKGKELGREIVRQGATIVTGATTGFPMYGAIGAKEAGGFSIGFSPAATEREHVQVYKLPLDYSDVIVFTGFGYSGRDLLFVRSVDAMIIGCGRIGTINEFTVAYEDRRPIGILEGAWETDKILRTIIENSNRPASRVVFDSDPKALIERIVEMIKEDKAKLNLTYDHPGSGPKRELIL